MPEFKQKEKIEERDIVLEMVKEVSKKFLIEFRGGEHKKIVHHGNWSEEITEPDSRKEAIQGVELLTNLLYPYFKDIECKELGMEKKHKKLLEETKKLLKKYEEEGKDNIDVDTFIRDKLQLMKDWFRELIMLLRQINYMRLKEVIRR